jgi:hypothetical protein
MLISHKYKFIFVHIAKTGGTSIRSALTPLLLTDPYRILQYLINRLSGLTNHKIGVKFPRHAKIITAQEILPREYFDKLFKFAFVRNPWDLQVSSYFHVRRERPYLVEHISSFEDFLKFKLEEDRPYHYILDASKEPQWYSLIDIKGRCIVDFIGRYENLKQDFDKVCKKIGINKKIKLPHKRKALDRASDYRIYYTDKAAELVAKYYQVDIENLGYTFD